MKNLCQKIGHDVLYLYYELHVLILLSQWKKMKIKLENRGLNVQKFTIFLSFYHFFVILYNCNLCLLFYLARSYVDQYTMGKEITELANFQHQSGGFYDNVREANARDTMRGVWIASLYGAYYTFDVQRAFRWFQTLHNRDGGAGYTPGSKSSIYGTYCYMQIANILSPQAFDGPRVIEFLKTCYLLTKLHFRLCKELLDLGSLL